MKVIYAKNRISGKLKARKVDLEAVIAEAIERAKQRGTVVIISEIGGTVKANSYRYRAYTEAVVAIALPEEDSVAVYATEMNARNATVRGVYRHCCGEEFAAIGEANGRPERKQVAIDRLVASAKEVVR